MFASDNFAGVHPEIMQALAQANSGYVAAYGEDPYTAEAKAKLQEQFGDAAVYFVLTGTAANVLGIKSILAPYEAVICAKSAHIMTSECGALEQYIGCQLLTVVAPQGKLTPALVTPFLEYQGNVHHAQPKVISISQATEWGTVYTLAEIRALADFAHKNGLYLHMDGARLANAAASQKCTLKAMTQDVGVDMLSFGGTKNGLMIGEALLFFGKLKETKFPFIQKQGMQLVSKMRFVAAQFLAYFENDLWLKNAEHSNRMARLLEERLRAVFGVKIVEPVEANALFVEMPKAALQAAQKESYFLIWNEAESIARFMTGWDTNEEDVVAFAGLLERTVRK